MELQKNNHRAATVQNLSFVYSDGTKALENITFEIAYGETIGLVGANGAGKSTLMLLLCGLLESSGGTVSICGETMTPKNFQTLSRKLGVVFQNSDDQLFTASVYEDIAFGPKQMGLEGAEIDTMVQKAMAATGVSHLAHRAPHRLSGGEKRSVALATALVMAPELLILDEPTTGLDPRSRRRLINLLKSFDHTKLITSHDLDLIWDTCSRVLVMNQGQLVAVGDTHMLLSDEALLERCGLELPLAMQACPKCGQNQFVGGQSNENSGY